MPFVQQLPFEICEVSMQSKFEILVGYVWIDVEFVRTQAAKDWPIARRLRCDERTHSLHGALLRAHQGAIELFRGFADNHAADVQPS